MTAVRQLDCDFFGSIICHLVALPLSIGISAMTGLILSMGLPMTTWLIIIPHQGEIKLHRLLQSSHRSLIPFPVLSCRGLASFSVRAALCLLRVPRLSVRFSLSFVIQRLVAFQSV
jgi:hypothetical protein